MVDSFEWASRERCPAGDAVTLEDVIKIVLLRPRGHPRRRRGAEFAARLTDIKGSGIDSCSNGGSPELPSTRHGARLRADRHLLPAAIDEILRLDAPLMSNRRITTRPVEIGGRHLAAGERLTILWGSVNRDEAAFGDPDAVRLDRDPADNLLYGAGIHVCPGAPLARMELRDFMRALLDATVEIGPVPGRPPVRARYPVGGYAEVPLRVRRR